MGNLLNWQIAGITIIAGKLEAIHAIASGLGSLGLELSEAESSSVAPTAVNFASRNSLYILEVIITRCRLITYKA